MERPAKKQKISEPDIRLPPNSGSRMAEGLFTSETGITSDETDRHRPTRTIDLSNLQRRALFKSYVERRGTSMELVRRVPDATVTANAVLVNVNEGGGTAIATVIAISDGQTVVSLSDVGTVTVPGISSLTSSILSDTLSISPSISLPTGSASSSNTITSLPGALNGTSSTSDRTVTVTTTSTLDLSITNGTVIVMNPATQGRATGFQSGSDSASAIPTGIGGPNQSSGNPTSTFGPGGTGAPATPGAGSSASAATPTSSHSSSGGSSGGGLSPTQQQVVGGVVGGLAGVAVVLLVLLIFLRWYRRRLKARGELPEQLAQRQLPAGPGHAHTMSQRSSGVPLVATLRNSLGKWRPSSAYTQGTTATVASVPDSERGFQKVAGRKIAPVLGTGSDPYGGNYGAFEKDTAAGPSEAPHHTRNERSLAGSSFYRDSGGFYGGRGGNDSPVYPPSPTIGTAVSGDPGPSVRDFGGREKDDDIHPSQISLPSSRPDGLAALRPSPARTPVTISPASSSFKLPIQQAPPTMENAPPVPPIAPGLKVPKKRSADAIGRTLASQDGSRVSGRSVRSRFSESIS